MCIKLEVVSIMDKVTESTTENEKGRGAEEWITMDIGQNSS
jgi:hypothetical protein